MKEYNFTTTEKNQMHGMTVFNSKKVNRKKQPMFFGKPLGVQRYDQFKYPVFDKLTQQQLGYFWRPEEVSLQKDRADYANLRPEQNTSSPPISNIKFFLIQFRVEDQAWRSCHIALFLNLNHVWKYGDSWR